MGPHTRSQAALVSNAAHSEESEDQEEDLQVEVHLSRALKSARKLKQEAAALRKRNAELEKRLDRAEQAEGVSIQPKRGRKGGPTVAELQGEVRKLRKCIYDLEKTREKDRKKIEKLRIKEIKADAAELAEAAEFEVGDSADRMRKLLRHFHDTVVSSSIEENEECPICMEPLQLKKCGSLPCEHTFCETCITKISPGSEVIACPQCRALCPRDEIELVQYTASQQWDALLDVAKEWAKMDVRRQEDTSEEEAEEEFINDELPGDDVRSSSSSKSANLTASSPDTEQHPVVEPNTENLNITLSNKRRPTAFSPESSPLSERDTESLAALNDPALPPEHNGESAASHSRIVTPPVVTPPRAGTFHGTTTPPYAQSPTKDKRKRLEDLAARKRKRR